MKAFLVAEDLPAPRSHDLAWLCEGHPALSRWAQNLAPLTDGAVVQRYPGDEGAEIDLSDGLRLVGGLLTWVAQSLSRAP